MPRKRKTTPAPKSSKADASPSKKAKPSSSPTTTSIDERLVRDLCASLQQHGSDNDGKAVVEQRSSSINPKKNGNTISTLRSLWKHLLEHHSELDFNASAWWPLVCQSVAHAVIGIVQAERQHNSNVERQLRGWLWGTTTAAAASAKQNTANDENDKNDNPMLWSLLWETLFLGKEPSQDNAETTLLATRLWTAVLPFPDATAHVSASFQNNNSDSSSKNNPMRRQTWPWMPHRRLELELRRRNIDIDEPELTVLPANKPVLVRIVDHLLAYVGGEPDAVANDNHDTSPSSLQQVQATLELLADLLSNIDTRDDLVVYLDAVHLVVYLQRWMMPNDSDNSSSSSGNQQPQLIRQLAERVCFLIDFVVPETTTTTNKITNSAASRRRHVYHERATAVQKMCHRYYPDDCSDLIFASVGQLCRPGNMHTLLAGLSDANLRGLLHKLRLVDGAVATSKSKGKTKSTPPPLMDRAVAEHILEHYVSIPVDPLQALAEQPLYPTEQVLWDTSRIPSDRRSKKSSPHNNSCLALPKLTTSYLSYVDYLWRNFTLYQLESAYEIRADLMDVLRRVQPRTRVANSALSDESRTEFTGWARMALEVSSTLEITKVVPPRLGQRHPAQVVARVGVDLQPCGAAIRREWEELSEFDHLFLVTVDAGKATGEVANDGNDDDAEASFPQQHGVETVRGCMILNVQDEGGSSLSDPKNAGVEAKGTKRVFTVALDPSQYRLDVNHHPAGSDVYRKTNLLVRRHGRENNFKSVLETIRNLLVGGGVAQGLPLWLQPVLLGHGSPAEATFDSVTLQQYARDTPGVPHPHDDALDFCDAFLDAAHVRESFPGSKVMVKKISGELADDDEARWNCKVKFLESGKIEATPYASKYDGSGNPIRFTPAQIQAIRSGLSPGLTLVQGPPGTGKTDVAVQIIASLYHSFPTQRTVIITHSNAALNDIFQKVMLRGDVEERYLVRLGAGERELQTDSTHDFTKVGRVAYSFSRRAKLLEEVQLLSESLGISGKAERGADGSPSYTCESAEHFDQHQVQRRIREFRREMSENADANVAEVFPFTGYFKVEGDNAVTVESSEAHFKLLESIFAELAEYRPFELLRSQRQRADYLIMKQARVVAMTCTHAALARSQLLDLGFEYDNLVVEEAGQMLEIESFVPLLLQKGRAGARSSGMSRLKRICVMGDQNQLPPIIKNMSIARYSSLDQSMFARLVKVGVPCVLLDKQGRTRSEIAKLYSWRYEGLGNLSRVESEDRFKLANAGMAHTFQLINVEDFNGHGETSPTAHFYQNLGEAEYAVALFQYMVLIGYSPNQISILTTYNGQKALLSDIVSNRCGPGTPLAGIRPGAISTVDQYQGQQNDIIILSLVRTKTVGHLRDIRRLVVAVSRARLGLYVLCRQAVFANHDTLGATMTQFQGRSTKLQLVIGEQYPTSRLAGGDTPAESLYEVDDAGHLGSMVYELQGQL